MVGLGFPEALLILFVLALLGLAFIAVWLLWRVSFKGLTAGELAAIEDRLARYHISEVDQEHLLIEVRRLRASKQRGGVMRWIALVLLLVVLGCGLLLAALVLFTQSGSVQPTQYRRF